MTRLYGRAPIGQRVRENAPVGSWNTTTLVAAVRAEGPRAPMLLEGAMDGEAFAAWVEKILVPVLRPRDIVVMDNLSSHKEKTVRPAIEAAGARVLDLPPYSPDLNPIEKMWSKIKTHLRRAKARCADTLCAAVGQALDAVTTQDIKGWFESCGYNI